MVWKITLDIQKMITNYFFKLSKMAEIWKWAKIGMCQEKSIFDWKTSYIYERLILDWKMGYNLKKIYIFNFRSKYCKNALKTQIFAKMLKKNIKTT